jgi:hypothetical protein
MNLNLIILTANDVMYVNIVHFNVFRNFIGVVPISERNIIIILISKQTTH